MQAWQTITTDSFILKIIKYGITLDFSSIPGGGRCTPPPVSTQQGTIITNEIETLLDKQAIVVTTLEEGSFLYPVFTTEKADGSARFILNLKRFNTSIQYVHFKMESMDNVLHMMTPNVWMASIDLKDAYYSIQVHPAHQKYLTFFWDSRYYKFVCLPNGYTQAPMLFTKLLKCPYSFLRKQGHQSVVYIDDSYLQGHSFASCYSNVCATMDLLQKLGFTINLKKSVLTPTQSLEFLGFILDSQRMIITLTPKRVTKILDICVKLLSTYVHKIRFVSSAIGMFIAALQGVKFGKLHYRNLERDKYWALHRHNGNLDRNMTLSHQAQSDIRWWHQHVSTSFNFVHPPAVSITIYSDASLEGWGATDTHKTVGGRWTPEDMPQHINVLALQAAKLALKALASQYHDLHILLRVENTTSVSYINKMGGTHSHICNVAARSIWDWAIERNIWLSAAFIPGCQNVVADFHSRSFKDNTEWSLNYQFFHKLVACFHTPDIDLFASQMNAKLPKYVPWKPDPDAFSIDAFSLPWGSLDFYVFPPFSVIPRVLHKIQQDRATGLVILPQWTTQSWFPTMLKLLIHHPVQLRPSRNLLFLPGNPQLQHPLHEKLTLLVTYLSGQPSRSMA